MPDAATVVVRRADERGHTDLGWLNSYHSFSFGEYHDRNHMGFRTLRVINDDRVAPGKGFGAHPHQDMEIITYVLEGALEHKDSMGNGSIIRPGDVQRMSAGTGVTHSEFNPSDSELAHFLQIWILPKERGLEPSYEQRAFSDEEKLGRLLLIGSTDGRDGSITIHQDVNLYASRLEAGQQAGLSVSPDRHIYAQSTHGRVTVNGMTLTAGDAVTHSKVARLDVTGEEAGSELLVFDLA